MKYLVLLAALLVAGCELPQERLVCRAADGRVTYRSPNSPDWRFNSNGVWVSDSHSLAYRQSAFDSCGTEPVIR